MTRAITIHRNLKINFGQSLMVASLQIPDA